MCPSSGGFSMTYKSLCGYKALNSPTLFSMTLRTRFLPDAFHHLVPNDNIHCQTPLKKREIWLRLFGRENASWQIWHFWHSNFDSATCYGVHFPAILSPVYTIQPVVKPVVKPVWQQVQPVVSCKRGISNYNGMTAYICRRFMLTTAFLDVRPIVISFMQWVFTRPRAKIKG